MAPKVVLKTINDIINAIDIALEYEFIGGYDEEATHIFIKIQQVGIKDNLRRMIIRERRGLTTPSLFLYYFL